MKRLAHIKLRPDERRAINAFSRRLKKTLGKQLVSVLLFGSKVRSDFHKDSDIDLYILVKRKTIRISDRVASITADILDDYDVLLSPVMYDLHEEHINMRMKSFFFEAVKSEGIPL
jgi:predicted nucleotidyltransferase